MDIAAFFHGFSKAVFGASKRPVSLFHGFLIPYYYY